MADIAELGLKIDSGPLKEGARALDDLSSASVKAEKSSGGLRNAMARIEKLLAAVERATRDVERAVLTMASGTASASAKVNALGTASSNAASKVQDLSSAATGMSAAYTRVEQAAERVAVANDNAAASASRLVNAYAAVGSTVERVNRVTGASGGVASADRAADIAAFGASLDALRAKFNPVFAVISQYRSTLAEIRSAHTVGAISADEMAAAISRERQAALGAISAIKSFNVALNDNNKVFSVGSHHTANLAAQFQDVAVSAAGGANAMQVALQQGTQMAMVFSAMAAEGGKGASALSAIGQAFAVVLSPASLVVIAVTALAAGLIQFVNWGHAAAAVLNGLAAVLPQVAEYAALAGGAMALVFAPSIISGAVTMAAAIGRVTVSLLGMAGAFALANPAVALVAGFVAVVAAANAFRADLARIFGRDIVGDAKNAVNLLIGSFVGAYNAVLATWKMLPNAYGDLVYQAVNNAIAGIESLINAAGDRINAFIAWANQAVGTAIPTVGKASFGGIGNPYAGKAAATADTYGAEVRKALAQDYVGQTGAAISSAAGAASSKLKQWAKDLVSVEDGTKKVKSAAEKAAQAYARIVTGADQRIASLQAEAAAAGLTEEAAARLRYEQELLNQATEKDINLSASQRAELAAKAAAMAHFEVAAKKVREAYDFVRDGVKGFIEDLRSGLQQGQSFWQAFGNASINVLDKIIKKIEDELVNALLGLGSNGTLGGILSGLLGSGGTVGATTGASYGFASGGYTGNHAASRVAGIVHGGEYVFSKRATDRIGVGALEAMHNRAKGYADGGYVSPASVPHLAGGGGGDAVTIAPVLQIDARGSNLSADQIRAIVAPMLEATAKQVLREAPQVVEKARARKITSHRT